MARFRHPGCPWPILESPYGDLVLLQLWVEVASVLTATVTATVSAYCESAIRVSSSYLQNLRATPQWHALFHDRMTGQLLTRLSHDIFQHSAIVPRNRSSIRLKPSKLTHITHQ